MKAWQLAAPREWRLLDLPAPTQPGPNEALVRVQAMGICGTDFSCYAGRFPFFQYPRIPGHELGVEVVALGSDVTHLQVGDRCSVEPYLNCGRCFACRRGASNCCAELRVLGVMQDGGLCELLILPAHKLHPSHSLNYHQLALVETLAIGSHAAARAEPKGGEQALIIGAGPIGLATLEFLLPRGAAVSVLDLSADRLAFCRQHYPIAHALHATTEAEIRDQVAAVTNGERFPVVIDATGNAQSMASALQWVAPTGTLVYVGITSDNLVFPHIAMHRPEVTLKASRNALPHDFREIIAAIERGAIDTQKWITHRCPFARVDQYFAKLLEPGAGVLKALIVDFGS